MQIRTVPVFYIPVGHRRRANGKVVLFREKSAKAALGVWADKVMSHPAALAAGACVIIGPTHTSYYDFGSHTVIQSDTKDGEWKPAAIDDPPRLDRACVGKAESTP